MGMIDVIKKLGLGIYIIILLTSLVFADTAATISAVVCSIYGVITGIMPILALLSFVLAGVMYAAGQFFGAEMKAKAQGYAMSLLVGAFIALIITILGPTIVKAMWNTENICG